MLRLWVPALGPPDAAEPEELPPLLEPPDEDAPLEEIAMAGAENSPARRAAQSTANAWPAALSIRDAMEYVYSI